MQLFRASCATLEANIKGENAMYFICTMLCFESRFHIHKKGHNKMLFPSLYMILVNFPIPPLGGHFKMIRYKLFFHVHVDEPQ